MVRFVWAIDPHRAQIVFLSGWATHRIAPTILENLQEIMDIVNPLIGYYVIEKI
jgi:hypothetical protein